MTKISVIIPTRNRPASLRSAVSSVLAQGIEDLEILVIDDYSEEEYWPAIESLQGISKQIKLYRNDVHLGVSASRNRGLDLAKGEFILFLDDDDDLLPNTLVQALKNFETCRYDLVSWKSEVLGGSISHSRLERYNRQQREPLDLYTIQHNPAEHIFLYVPQIHTFLVRRTVIGNTRFDVSLSYGEDILFWLQLAEKDLNFQKLNFVGCRYHIHGKGLSGFNEYENKAQLYVNLINRGRISGVIKNLCCIKLAYLSFSKRRWAFVKWSIRAVANPILFFKHLRYYI